MTTVTEIALMQIDPTWAGLWLAILTGACLPGMAVGVRLWADVQQLKSEKGDLHKMQEMLTDVRERMIRVETKINKDA